MADAGFTPGADANAQSSSPRHANAAGGPAGRPHREDGYWYRAEDDLHGSVQVLKLLRRYREVERQMRARTRDSMGMSETDLVALRHIVKAHGAGMALRQRELAQLLDLSTASVSVLVDRLSRQGHVRRVPHPGDRRSVAVEPTTVSDHALRAILGTMHQRMLESVEMLTDSERAAVTKFLTAMIGSLDEPDDRPEG